MRLRLSGYAGARSGRARAGSLEWGRAMGQQVPLGREPSQPEMTSQISEALRTVRT